MDWISWDREFKSRIFTFFRYLGIPKFRLFSVIFSWNLFHHRKRRNYSTLPSTYAFNTYASKLNRMCKYVVKCSRLRSILRRPCGEDRGAPAKKEIHEQPHNCHLGRKFFSESLQVLFCAKYLLNDATFTNISSFGRKFASPLHL